MLLAIDAGNTNITFAVYGAADLKGNWRIGTVARRTGDEYAALLSALLRENGLAFADIDAAAICSVVPPMVDALLRFCAGHLGIDSPLVLSPEMDLGIDVDYEPVTDVGADRIANAIAAHANYDGTVVVVDLGTGTTVDAVSADGKYLGGAIAPGIQISLEALFSRAARLSGVVLEAPDRAIGRTTATSLQSGIVFGFAGMVDSLVARFIDELGGADVVVATGGLAELIAPHCKHIDHCDDLLTLEGLRLAYQRLRG